VTIPEAHDEVWERGKQTPECGVGEFSVIFDGWNEARLAAEFAALLPKMRGRELLGGSGRRFIVHLPCSDDELAADELSADADLMLDNLDDELQRRALTLRFGMTPKRL
jgi:hypothetical protein